jgi:hypothetical protein
MSQKYSEIGVRALNHIVAACRGEELAIARALCVLGGAARKDELRRQSARRVTFRGDISAAIRSLGGAPALQAGYGALSSSALWRMRWFVAGPHAGDAYAACARAAERTSRAYFTLLERELPSDVRFGLASQFAEVEADREELRRLRWGASPMQMLPSSTFEHSAPALATDQRASDVWNDDGGHLEPPKVLETV